MYQTGWLAVAVYPDDRPGTGGTALAGSRGGHAVDGQCGQRRGSGPTSRGYRPARPQAAFESAGSGEAPAYTPVSVEVALGAGMPNHRSAHTPSLAAGARALAGHPHLCGAVPRAVTR